jgi:hypothetical protein
MCSKFTWTLLALLQESRTQGGLSLPDEQQEISKRHRITIRAISFEVFWILCGIVLPLAAVIVEKRTEACARLFFDPAPTDWHLLLISLVPLTNLIGELLRISRFAGQFTWLASSPFKWINGMAIGIAGFYTLWFLPVTALCTLVLLLAICILFYQFVLFLFQGIGDSVVAVLNVAGFLLPYLIAMVFLAIAATFPGWGLLLLSLAPFSSLLACYRTRSTLFSLTPPVVPIGSKRAGVRSLRRLFLPVACGLLALLAIEIPSTATRVAMGMATNPQTSSNGLLLLRAFGNDDSMLRMCYERSHPTDIFASVLTWGRPVPYTKAREIYYRATGRPFNSRGIPASFRGKIHDRTDQTGADDVFDSDAELAGETVGGVVRGVTLARSEMTGVVDSIGNAATINWDMEFGNKSCFQREARAQILLPPHAVVSNALLWIDGRPKPAAFGSRDTTRAAYRGVVQRRRDPLLVTTYGPDRALAQCFPVPPDGKMHIQLGITAPLTFDSHNCAFLTMPMFLERNFQVDKHSIHLRTNGPVSNPGQVLRASQSWALDGNVSNSDLSKGKATVFISTGAHANWSWHRDSVENGKLIVQTTEAREIKTPERLFIVVDGSAALAEDAGKVAQVLKTVPAGIALSLLRAGDKVELLAENVSSSSEAAWTSALANLQCQTFVGGQDDTEALIFALNRINGRPNSAILWLHGPQAVEIDDATPLATSLSAAGANVCLYELQLENGPNRVVEALDGIRNLSRLPILDSPLVTLAQLFSAWNNSSIQFEPTLKQATLDLSTDGVSESRIDLSPLWANQKVSALRQTPDPGDIGAAVELAERYHVVTPVSGAVVLETQDDYRKYALEPPPQSEDVQANQLVSDYPAPSFGFAPVQALGPLLSEKSIQPLGESGPRRWLLVLSRLSLLVYLMLSPFAPFLAPYNAPYLVYMILWSMS